MRKLLIAVLALVLVGSGSAIAHQPVVLLESDISAAKGPLLVDGTISFAVRAAFTKAGQRKAFRAQLAEGDSLAVQLLIIDKKPENTLKITQLPSVVITGPTGKKVTLKINRGERDQRRGRARASTCADSNADSNADSRWLHHGASQGKQHSGQLLECY